MKFECDGDHHDNEVCGRCREGDAESAGAYIAPAKEDEPLGHAEIVGHNKDGTWLLDVHSLADLISLPSWAIHADRGIGLHVEAFKGYNIQGTSSYYYAKKETDDET